MKVEFTVGPGEFTRPKTMPDPENGSTIFSKTEVDTIEYGEEEVLLTDGKSKYILSKGDSSKVIYRYEDGKKKIEVLQMGHILQTYNFDRDTFNVVGTTAEILADNINKLLK